MTADAQPLLRYPSYPEKEAQMRVAEWLVVHSIEDLDRRSAPSTSHYDVVGISHTLRRLFLDEHAAVGWSRRRLKLPEPRFEYTPRPVATPRSLDGGRTISPVLGFADASFTSPSQRSGVDAFLAAPIGQAYDHPISVRDLIDVYANVLGGVHTGKSLATVHDLVRSATISLDPYAERWARTLQHVAVVAARGLRPTADALRSSVR